MSLNFHGCVSSPFQGCNSTPLHVLHSRTKPDRAAKFLAVNSVMMFVIALVKLIDASIKASDSKMDALAADSINFFAQLTLFSFLMTLTPQILKVSQDQPQLNGGDGVCDRPPFLNPWLASGLRTNKALSVGLFIASRFVTSCILSNVSMDLDGWVGFCKRDSLQRLDSDDLTCPEVDHKNLVLFFYDALIPTIFMTINALSRKAEETINAKIHPPVGSSDNRQDISSPNEDMTGVDQNSSPISVQYLNSFAWALLFPALNTAVLAMYWGVFKLVDVPWMAPKNHSTFFNDFGLRSTASLLYALATCPMMNAYLPDSKTHDFSVYKNDGEGQFEKVGPASFLDDRRMQRFPYIALMSSLATCGFNIGLDRFCELSNIRGSEDARPEFCPTKDQQDLVVFGLFISMSVLGASFEHVVDRALRSRRVVQSDQRLPQVFL